MVEKESPSCHEYNVTATGTNKISHIRPSKRGWRLSIYLTQPVVPEEVSFNCARLAEAFVLLLLE